MFVCFVYIMFIFLQTSVNCYDLVVAMVRWLGVELGCIGRSGDGVRVWPVLVVTLTQNGRSPRRTDREACLRCLWE